MAHCWTMTGQHGVRCEWVCTTHDPPCHKTTFDGKGSCLCRDPLREVDPDCPQHGYNAPGFRRAVQNGAGPSKV